MICCNRYLRRIGNDEYTFKGLGDDDFICGDCFWKINTRPLDYKEVVE